MGAIVNSNKKYFYSFAILISLIATSLIISAAGVNTNIGWHPIQQEVGIQFSKFQQMILVLNILIKITIILLTKLIMRIMLVQ